MLRLVDLGIFSADMLEYGLEDGDHAPQLGLSDNVVPRYGGDIMTCSTCTSPVVPKFPRMFKPRANAQSTTLCQNLVSGLKGVLLFLTIMNFSAQKRQVLGVRRRVSIFCRIKITYLGILKSELLEEDATEKVLENASPRIGTL